MFTLNTTFFWWNSYGKWVIIFLQTILYVWKNENTIELSIVMDSVIYFEYVSLYVVKHAFEGVFSHLKWGVRFGWRGLIWVLVWFNVASHDKWADD